MRNMLAVTAALTCLPLIATGGQTGVAQPEILPSISDTIRMDEWKFLGPFSTGYREGIQGAVSDPARLVPHGEYRSMLAQGGSVTWKTASPDSTGWVDIEFDNVYWDTIMDIYGYAGLVNKTFAYAEIEVPSDCRALIVAERIGTFYINGREYYGGPYGHDFVRIPVRLSEGKNPVVLSLSGFAGHRFRFEAIPAPSPVMILNDYTAPDLVAGETGDLWAAITVLNTTGLGINDAVVAAGDGAFVTRGETPVGSLAPLCVKKVPVRIHVASVPEEVDEVIVPVSVMSAGRLFADSVRLRVRSPEQSVKRTFISRIDSSCQYFAVLPPDDFRHGEEYGLILSLHGAGVRAEGQADAYKPKPRAYVIAPTNRRPFGFDWQDWGRLDALEVLELAVKTLPVDDSRVYLTGHSMGGHGVWHVGLHHPDLFAAMAPEAGWTSFELYIPWFLQKSYIYADPRAVGMRDLALREDKPLNFVENAMNLGVFIVHGGVDDNVPTMHARMFAGRLEQLDYDYEYWEVPGKSHWWHDDSLDVSCVDYPIVMDFLQSHERYPEPLEIRFRTVNLGTANRAYWVEVSAQEEPMRDTEIQATLLPSPDPRHGMSRIVVSTLNVAEFTLSPSPELLPAGPVEVVIDGEGHSLRYEEGSSLVFAMRAGRFRPGPMERGALAKSPGLYGPIKQAYFSPFILIYGTAGGRKITGHLLHQARSQAFRWWRRGNGYVEVIPDTLVTDSIISSYNLILFGGPSENHITGLIGRDLAVRLAGGGIRVGDRIVEGSGLAARFVYPNPLNRGNLVVIHMGTDTGGLLISDFFKTLHAGAGLPDFMVFDESVRTRGWAGVICAGYFDSAWQVDSGLMFMAR